jgi:hypothetical protein
MATKFGYRNYSRTGNNVTFTVVALNADGSIDTGYTGGLTFNRFNFTGSDTYTFVAGDQGARTFTMTITNPAARASLTARFPDQAGFDDAAVLVVGGPNSDNFITSAEGANLFVGGPSGDTYGGNLSDDLFRLELGGNDTATGGGGNDGFYFGAAYTAADTVNGGAGIYDSIGLQGNYSVATTLGSMLETELVVLLPGNDTRFGDTAGNFYDYNLVANASTIVSNNRLTIQANTLRVGEDLTFNGSASAIESLIYGGFGREIVTGGSGNDGFYFGQGRFGASDIVNGGAGTMDQLGLQGIYHFGTGINFGAGQLSDIEFIVLLSASDNRFGATGGAVSYYLATNDGNVAAGQRLIIQANTLKAGENLTFVGGAETNGSFQVFSGADNDYIRGGRLGDDIWGGAGNDEIVGDRGADTLRGGSGNDKFSYIWQDDSLSSARDQILDFTTGDVIDLSVLGNFTFIGSGNQNGAEQLRVTQSGNQATVQVYFGADSSADLVIDVTVADGHTLTANDFTGVQSPAAQKAFVPSAGKFGLLANVSAIDEFDKFHDTRFETHSDFLGISPPNDFLL